MPARYDLVVVGAGPAGASAAYYAARAGLRTLLVDRKRFPRPKICGDGLTPRAVQALARMQVSHVFERHMRIDRVRLIAPTRTTELSYVREPEGPSFGLVVPRRVLDAELVQAAVRSGVELIEDAPVVDLLADRRGRVTGVVVERAGGRSRIRAAVTVAADGATGRVGRLLRGVRQRAAGALGWAARQYLTGAVSLGSAFEIHLPIAYRGERLPGYGWVFPLSPTDVNVGVGLLEPCPEPRVSVAEALAAFIALLTHGDPRFAGVRPAGPVEGGALGVRLVDPLRTPDGALLVGDAAGLVNPYTGEGISHALESGELAARAAARALQGHGRPNACYARMLRSRFPRHWALRDARRHVRWLYAAAASGSGGQRTRLVAALRALALDQPQGGGSTPRALPARQPSHRVLCDHLASRLAARLRRTDAVMAEAAAELLRDPASPASDLIQVGGAIAHGVAHRNRVLADGLLALATFVLAHDLAAQLPERSTHAAHAVSSATLTLADCLLTEATGVLVHLPGPTRHAVVAAASRSAAARQALAEGDRPAEALAEIYLDLAAPAVCAAELAAEAAGLPPPDTSARKGFAAWYAVTRRAVTDASRGRRGDVTPILARQLDRRVFRAAADDPALHELGRVLRGEAHALLARSLAPGRRRAVAGP